MGLFTPKVHVTMVDSRSGDLIAETRMKATDLPESFAPATTLHLGDKDWSVISADPETRDEYVKSKKLALILSPVESIDPSTLLYSLPSIENALPDIDETTVGSGACLLAEDDWRQVEFISRAHEQDIDRELAAIRAIHRNEAAEIGFRKIHVRSVIRTPIVDPFPFAGLADACQTCRRDWLGFHPEGHRVVDGFAYFGTGSFVVYGLAPHDRVSTLGVQGASADDALIAALDRLATSHDLCLVDWCRCVKAAPGTEGFADILNRD